MHSLHKVRLDKLLSLILINLLCVFSIDILCKEGYLVFKLDFTIYAVVNVLPASIQLELMEHRCRSPVSVTQKLKERVEVRSLN